VYNSYISQTQHAVFDSVFDGFKNIFHYIFPRYRKLRVEMTVTHCCSTAAPVFETYDFILVVVHYNLVIIF